MWNNEGIQVEAIETCLLCDSKGLLLYHQMRDWIFNAPGVWSLFRCPKDGLVWLNPRPTVESIAKVYAAYYTHSLAQDQSCVWIFIKNKIFNSVLKAKYGYNSLPGGLGSVLIGKVLSTFVPMAKESSGGMVNWVKGPPQGKLLDVGCGNGNFLSIMQKLGWEVWGVEPDPQAAKIAQELLRDTIIIGTLEPAGFPDNSFDVITAVHVLEHLHQPLGFLQESLRVLKPGGRLIIITPNTNSLGHRLFGKFWKALEVPRHLFLFTPALLGACLEKAGFRIESLHTTARLAWGVWYQSSLIRRNVNTLSQIPRYRRALLRFQGLTFQLAEHLLLKLQSHRGDGIVLTASKPFYPL